MTVRGRLLGAFLVGAVITGIVGGVGMWVLEKNLESLDTLLNEAVAAKDRARQMNVAMLEARRSEKDYILRQDWKYVDRVAEHIAVLKGHAEWVMEHEHDAAHQEPLRKIIALAGEYQNGFLKAATDIRDKGKEDLGVIGQFRAKTHQVEGIINEQGELQLTSDLLQIRRSEKDYLLRGDEKYITRVADDIETFNANLAVSSVDLPTQALIVSLLEEYHELFDLVVEYDQTIAADIAEYTETVHAIEPLIEAMVVEETRAAGEEVVAIHDTTALALKVFVVIIAVAILVAVILGVVQSGSISKPLRLVAGQSEKIAVGDLSVEPVNLDRKDELGVLAQSFGEMVSSLNGVITGVNDAVEQVASGSQQVSQASQSLSQGATEQASSLEEITSSLNEINGQSRQNAESATEANVLAKGAVQKAEGGNEKMQRLGHLMGEINTSSEEIKKVVKVIDDIAFQINLLALNANVEAARAGKYGKGFAVVAEEVRNLAVRSADAVKETTQIVELSTGNIEEGVKAAEDTVGQLGEIVTGSGKVADYLGEIAMASQEQADGVEQINSGLEQIDQVTQSNTASAEEAAAAAQELSSQAQQLRALVSHFSLRTAETVEDSERFAS